MMKRFNSLNPSFLVLCSIALIAAGCGDDGAPPSDAGGDAGGDGGPAECGDMDLEGDETCDDGNTADGDGCSANCASLERCGNGYVDMPIGEICDDGNSVNGDGCSADCTSDESCGNSVVDLGVGEVCDDGNTNDGDGCSADCMTGPTCGDGIANGGELCDDGNTEGGDGCSADCSSDETCGNTVTDAGEECDDGNTDADDGCSATCAIERCGNSLVEGAEVCDDGNMVDGDGCEADCSFTCAAAADCDDGAVCNGAETCNATSHLCEAGADAADATDCGGGMVCRSGICGAPVCGNSIVEGTEACDDGDSTSGDGCENDCTFSCTMDTECNDSEACTGVETCDVGSHTCTNPADLTDGTSCGGGNVCNGGACVAASCGNSMTEGSEDCDDGNATNGDGCDNDCTFSCAAAADCDDGDLCNGAETCNTTSHTCAAGTAASDGAVCDRDMMAGTRDICLSAICSASTCGDAFIDTADGEDCEDGNTTPGDGCENDCTFTCSADADCDDGDVCNGAETCTGANVCAAGSAAAEGTLCDRDMMAGTRDLCIMGTCSLTTCGDGFLDTAATPAEVCDDGNLTAGDGCEPDCTITSTGTGPTAFRVISLDLMHPHVYADIRIIGGWPGCTDITDSAPLGSASLNDTLQESVDDYTLNYITVHRPLDIAMATNPVDFVEGTCTAAAVIGDPPTCQEGAMGTAVTYTGTNSPAGMTCYDPDLLGLYNYSAPNTVSGPCFLTDEDDFLINVSGVLIPLQDARVAATYAGGVPPNRLVSGVIVGFLSEADARSAIIPDSVGPPLGGNPLYQHLADGGAADSACSSNDDSAMYMGQNGFWFFLNFTSVEADWVGP